MISVDLKEQFTPWFLLWHTVVLSESLCFTVDVSAVLKLIVQHMNNELVGKKLGSRGAILP